MKKRVLLLPLSLLAVLSCTRTPSADVRNKYASREDCLKDNPRVEINKQLDQGDWTTDDKLCEHVQHEGNHYFLGPAYPYAYYGNSGFYQGYWIGRSSMYSSGVVHESGQSFTHTQIARGGGIASVVTSAKAANPSISRGGFGSSGRGSAVGG